MENNLDNFKLKVLNELKKYVKSIEVVFYGVEFNNDNFTDLFLLLEKEEIKRIVKLLESYS